MHRMAVIKRTKCNRCSEGVEKKGVYAVGGGVNSIVCYVIIVLGKQRQADL